MTRIVAIDMDGVLCENPPKSNYGAEALLNLKPIQKNIDRTNRLFEDDTFVIIYTSRRRAFEGITRYWLDKHNVSYHLVVCGKLWADYYIDDKNRPFDSIIFGD